MSIKPEVKIIIYPTPSGHNYLWKLWKENGDLIMKNDITSIITKAKYNFDLSSFKILDSNDNMIYLEDSDGFWEKCKYDDNGNLIYLEDSTGYKEKCDFDDHGNIIYSENSTGYWLKCEFDKKDNEIYYEDSRGNWGRSEFDENNNLINYNDREY